MGINIQDLPEKLTLVSSDEIIGLDSLSSDRGTRFTIGALTTHFRGALAGLATTFGFNEGEVAPWGEGDNIDVLPIAKIPIQPVSKITGIEDLIDGRLDTTVVRTFGNQTIVDIKNFTGINPLLVNGSPVISLDDLEVEQVPSIPMNFDIISIAGAQGSTGSPAGSITIDTGFGPAILTVPVAQITRATLTSMDTGVVTNFLSTGLTFLVYQNGFDARGDGQTTVSPVYDTESNKNNAIQNFIPNGELYRLEVEQTITNEEGAYAQVNDELFVPQGAIIRGGTSVETLTASDCIDFRTTSRQVYTETIGRTTVATLTQNLQVNNSNGFAYIDNFTGSGIGPLAEGTHLYFVGFPHAGIVRRTTAFGIDAIGWGEILGVQYGDQFTNGLVETIPSGTEIRLAGASSTF